MNAIISKIEELGLSLQSDTDKQIFVHALCWTLLESEVVHSCSFSQVRNCIDQIKDFTLWLKILELFKFIYALFRVPSVFEGIYQDILSCFFSIVEKCTTQLEMLRENVDDSIEVHISV